MKGLFKLRNNEKGQSMVEFALVLPILIALVVGIIQFGFIFNVKITLANEAREAVRLIAVGSLDQNGADESVRNSLKDNSLISKYTEGTKLSVVAKTESLTNDEIQASVTITIPEFDLMVVSKPMSLSGSATMRVEPDIETDGSREVVDGDLNKFRKIFDLASEGEYLFRYNSNPDSWWNSGGSHVGEAQVLYNNLSEKDKNSLKRIYNGNGLNFLHTWSMVKDLYDHYSATYL